MQDFLHFPLLFSFYHIPSLSLCRNFSLPHTISPHITSISPSFYSHVMSSMSCTFARILLDRGGLPLFFFLETHVCLCVCLCLSLSSSRSLALSPPPSLPPSLSLCLFLCGCVCVCVCVSPPPFCLSASLCNRRNGCF